MVRPARKPKGWPRDLESVPTIARLKVTRKVSCRMCRRDLDVSAPHFGVSYRGRYGRATSHLCPCCAAQYVREVYAPSLLAKINSGIKAVHEDHGRRCPDCPPASGSGSDVRGQ